jgi:succinyl-CoA synthetase alpha subunit
MIQGLEALIRRGSTEVIVIVSKPPDPEVTEKVLAVAAKSKKPVIINFLGGDLEEVRKLQDVNLPLHLKKLLKKRFSRCANKACLI